jgi:hypothetical protein
MRMMTCSIGVAVSMLAVAGCSDDVGFPDDDLTTGDSTGTSTTSVGTSTSTSTTTDTTTSTTTDPGSTSTSTTTDTGSTSGTGTAGGTDTTGDTEGSTGTGTTGGAVVGPVTVNVDARGQFFFVTGAWVAFHDDQGTVLDAQVTTDSDTFPHEFTFDSFPPGGMITAGWYEDEGARVTTLTQAQPGETYDVTFHLPPGNVLVNPSAEGALYFDPNLPLSIASETSELRTDNTCRVTTHSIGTPPYAHNVDNFCTPDCVTPPCAPALTMDMVLWAIDESGDVLGYASSFDHPRTPQGDTPDVVDITGWTVGAPPLTTQVTDSPGNMVVDAWVQMYRDLSWPYRVQNFVSPPALAAGDNVGFSWDVASTFADVYRYDIFADGDGIGDIYINSRRPPGTLFVTHDLDAPVVTPSNLTWDATGSEFSVDLSAGVPPGSDAFVTSFVWVDNDNEWQGAWDIVTPQMPTSIATPELPSDTDVPNIGDFAPLSANYTVELAYEVWRVDSATGVQFSDMVDVWGRNEYPSPAFSDVAAATDEFAIVSYHAPGVTRPGVIRFRRSS